MHSVTGYNFLACLSFYLSVGSKSACPNRPVNSPFGPFLIRGGGCHTQPALVKAVSVEVE